MDGNVLDLHHGLLVDWHPLADVVLLDVVNSLGLLEHFEMVGVILVSLLLIKQWLIIVVSDSLWSLDLWSLDPVTLELSSSLLRRCVYLIKKLFKLRLTLAIYKYCRFIIP